MTPLSGKPAVVEVEPTNHGADVESTADGIQLVRRTNDLGAIGNSGALDDWAKQLGAVRKFESLETAAEGVKEDEASGVNLALAVSLLLQSFKSFCPQCLLTARSESIL